jgi:GNAT superfamily N-acetyltransferase
MPRRWLGHWAGSFWVMTRWRKETQFKSGCPSPDPRSRSEPTSRNAPPPRAHGIFKPVSARLVLVRQKLAAFYLICLKVACGGIGQTKRGILEGILAARRIIHISVVYVLPSFRRAGVGSKLMSRTLDWGRSVGGDYFDLNIVVGNPARSLYQKLGFSDAAINMTRPIVAC